MLQADVMWLVHKPWLERVSFLRRAPRPFMAELACSLKAQVSRASIPKAP